MGWFHCRFVAFLGRLNRKTDSLFYSVLNWFNYWIQGLLVLFSPHGKNQMIMLSVYIGTHRDSPSFPATLQFLTHEKGWCKCQRLWDGQDCRSHQPFGGFRNCCLSTGLIRGMSEIWKRYSMSSLAIPLGTDKDNSWDCGLVTGSWIHCVKVPTPSN